MAELYDEDTCCDYPTVNFYGAAQNADVATADIALGYGMLSIGIPYPRLNYYGAGLYTEVAHLSYQS